jgi:hypothetical protein
MMELMSTDNPVQPAPPTESVIEFGGAPEEAAPAARGRRSVTQLIHGLAADRRSVPLAAAVGAVALFASLISEWQTTVLSGSRFEEFESGRPWTAGITDLGAVGSGYAAGLFVLAAAVVLVLFGPPAGRRHVRLIGLAAGGVQLGLIAATASMLGDSSRVAGGLFFVVSGDPDEIQLTYGRGIYCAVLGVLAALLALWLAGRHLPPEAPARTAEEAPPEAEEELPEPEQAGWSWRRPTRAEPAEDERPDAPIDLTVSSVNPFTMRNEDRDKPAQRDE